MTSFPELVELLRLNKKSPRDGEQIYEILKSSSVFDKLLEKIGIGEEKEIVEVPSA